jgi:hypothetical protein
MCSSNLRFSSAGAGAGTGAAAALMIWLSLLPDDLLTGDSRSGVALTSAGWLVLLVLVLVLLLLARLAMLLLCADISYAKGLLATSLSALATSFVTAT